jgi:hypothetical protein
VLPRRDFLTKEACRLLRGGKDVVDRDASLLHVLRSEIPRHHAARKWSQFSMVAHSVPGEFEQRFLGVRVYYFST